MLHQDALPPTLSALAAEYEAATGRLEALVSRLDERLWATKPPAGGWSAAQCIAHLNITSARFLPLVHEAIRRAEGQGPRGEDAGSLDLIGRLLLWAIEPPYRLRARTPPAFDASLAEPMAVSVERFRSLQRQLESAIAASRGLLISKVKVESPFNRRVRYSLYTAFRIIPCHQRRHLWQAERAVDAVRRAS